MNTNDKVTQESLPLYLPSLRPRLDEAPGIAARPVPEVQAATVGCSGKNVPTPQKRQCVKCGHEWISRSGNPHPKHCTNLRCQTKFWEHGKPPELWESLLHVPETDDCIEWQHYIMPNGYGQVQYQGRLWIVHRLSHHLHIGPVADGLDTCHKCDNRKCYNPRHLFVGTRTDNMQDSKSKGRNFIPKGELSPIAKLTDDLVMEIRAIYRKGRRSPTNSAKLAAIYGVTEGCISAAARGKSWRHLDL